MNGRSMTWPERCEAARSRPILELLAELGLGEPRRAGQQYVMICPFHGERSPSCFINPQKNVWHCFGCGGGGGGIDLWMRARRVGFKKAVREMVP